MIRHRRSMRPALTLGAVVLSSWALALPASTVVLARPGRAPHALTASRLSHELAVATRMRNIPAHLDPPLSAASRAKPVINRNGCHDGRAVVRIRRCIYGDRTSHTSIVLFGDSHAAAWFPALNLVARQRHLRLVVMTKSGCPPAEVEIVRDGARYRECPLWRAGVKTQIAALHPALVVATTATYREEPAARPMSGVPTGNGSAWQDGWAAIFTFLRRAAGDVLFISDVPTLRVKAPECIHTHESDVRRCNTKRSTAIRQPTVKAQEIDLARRNGVSVIDPTPWFCARTACPVIVDQTILYRDGAHMTPSWSRFVAPVLGGAMAPILQREASAPR
jgi:hypothetical protein